MTDNELTIILNGCREKQQSSQHKLYSLFYNYAMTVARRYVISTHDTEEVVNDSFMKVFNKIEQYSYEASFKAWLRRIVVNTAIDHIRAQKRQPKVSDIEHFEFETEIETDILAAMSKAELLELVKQLPPAYRTCFNLYVIDEYSHDEIAELLGISQGTSKSNLARARQFLKKLILEQEGKLRHI
jgi:RNA polymerase sigma factor (sigma-70 family)